MLDRSEAAALVFAAVVAIGAPPLAAAAKAPSYATRNETITGTIASVQNLNHLFVADDRGYTDDVTLRSGAEVLSAGLRLEPGVRVAIAGSSGGSTFLATRISTSGQTYQAAQAAPLTPYSAGVPAYYPSAYYPPAAYYPVPAYYPYRPYPSDYFRFGFGYGPFYRGYGFGYGPFYRGYGFGYGPFYRGYGFGYGPFYRGYGFGFGSSYRYGFGSRSFSRGYGFGFGSSYRYGFGSRSFSRGYGSFRESGSHRGFR